MEKWTAERVKRIQQLIYETETISLNLDVKNAENGSDDMELGDLIIDKRNPFEDVENKFNRESLLDILRQLNDPRAERVLTLRFGLDGSGLYRTLDEIGAMYGITRERIRQIESNALIRLRKIVRKNKLKYEDFIGS